MQIRSCERSQHLFQDLFKKPKQHFDLSEFLKYTRVKVAREVDDSLEYLSSFDFFMRYIKSLNNLEFLEDFFMQGLRYIFAEDEFIGLPTKIDSLFEMLTYQETYYLLRIVYSEIGQISTINYPDNSEDLL